MGKPKHHIARTSVASCLLAGVNATRCAVRPCSLHAHTHTHVPQLHTLTIIHILTLLKSNWPPCSPCAAVLARTALRPLFSLRAASHTSRGGLLRRHGFATSCGLSRTLTHTLLASSVFHSRETHTTPVGHTLTLTQPLSTPTPHVTRIAYAHGTSPSSHPPTWLKSSASAFHYICDSILTTRLKFASFVHSFMLLAAPSFALLSFAHTHGACVGCCCAGDSNEISLSVEESNALRAKLGLKPLKIDDPDAEKADDDGEAAAPGVRAQIACL
jgi:hypothetical protein